MIDKAIYSIPIKNIIDGIISTPVPVLSNILLMMYKLYTKNIMSRVIITETMLLFGLKKFFKVIYQ